MVQSERLSEDEFAAAVQAKVDSAAPIGTGTAILLILLGLIMVSGQALFIQSMKRAPASTLMPAFYSILVFAALYDWALNGVFPSNIAVLGGALIITGALVLTKNGAPGRARRPS